MQAPTPTQAQTIALRDQPRRVERPPVGSESPPAEQLVSRDCDRLPSQFESRSDVFGMLECMLLRQACECILASDNVMLRAS
eukprot:CAMPEP_0203839710 /NCGR_PEP_ID=MMETSP0359-20131031/339_1 /ASSEMBLY_ACC=CAM_ASM_000338 /TAXON_ID=268821 /ORGANISM="Scrippsiella Hangoei, Strain SHTV-5" /LENGTH=81 /DNA_ID=CAMNT_0050753793 /DNA_START=70 /DNA_END=313 /DNA_ORIENTATION=-